MARQAALASLVVPFLAVLAAAQPVPAPQAEPPPVYRSSIELVALNVAVLDRDRRYVRGLSASDFAVFEDGVRQELAFFATGEVPLDLILLIDTSASMTDKMATVHEAALGFMRTLRGDDRGAVVAFSDTARILEPLTHDGARLATAIRSTQARGSTALYNAVYVAAKVFGRASKEGELRRQAVVVLSDGEDTSSLITFDDALEQVKRSGMTFFTISLRSKTARVEGAHQSQAVYAMRILARETGGEAYEPQRVDELAAVYGRIAEELGHQYCLAYMPKNGRADGRFRRVVVQVATRPELVARTRTGYYAGASRVVAGVQGDRQ
ncbi:MAG TPA: VWA domain-containing protein [Vicinamibacterales bacterium]|jgi:Ca-activated chloride channel family protein|nr:VWA domain-containing protein [Vicinamibacterales bacterium]